MIKMTIQDTEETAEFKVLEKPIIQKPLIAESDVVTIDNNLSTYVTGTQKRELTVGLGYLDSVGYETLRRIRDRQYAVLKYPTVTITADEPVDLGYGEDVPDYRQRLVQLKGKNLLDINVGFANAYIDNSGAELANTKIVLFNGYITVEPSTTYTFSSSHTNANMTPVFYTAEKAFISRLLKINTNFNTFTTPSNCHYIRLQTNYDNTVDTDSSIVATMNLQLELGPTATSYEAYFNIELCKIGEYQDYIYKSGDKWYVHKETGKVDFGELTWTATTNIIRGSTGATGIKYAPNNQTIMPAYAEKYSVRQGSGLSNNIGCMAVDTNKINVNTNGATDPTGLFYYQLATPTETEITNDTLKAQLNALQNSAFDRWTKVETSVQESSLQPYLTVTQGEITGSGKEVMLDGTTEDLLDFVILGDTTQQTYSGKNLIGFPANTISQDGLALTFEEDGTITINGTRSGTSASVYNASSLYNFPVGNITMTIIPMSGSFSGANIGYRTWSGSTQPWYQGYGANGSYNNGIYNATQAKINDVASIDFLIGSGTAVFNNFKFKIQVTAGTTHDTVYEKYVGGAPSPNPAFPQEVRTVNGNINFDFSGPSGVKTYTMVGKMALADQRIIDNCGTNEQVQVSFRESKQI